MRASSASCRNAILVTRGSARLTDASFNRWARCPLGASGRRVSTPEPSRPQVRGGREESKESMGSKAKEVARHHSRGRSVPHPEMARTERHHLSGLRLAAIDRQATFTTAVIKTGADRQAQWWRRWDGYPYVRTIGDRYAHIRPLRVRQKRAGQPPSQWSEKRRRRVRTRDPSGDSSIDRA